MTLAGLLLFAICRVYCITAVVITTVSCGCHHSAAPAGHSPHFEAPSVSKSPNIVVLQSTHVPCIPAFPIGHLLQRDSVSLSGCLPSSQSVHTPFVPAVPAGQSSHASAAAFGCLPSEHTVQFCVNQRVKPQYRVTSAGGSPKIRNLQR